MKKLLLILLLAIGYGGYAQTATEIQRILAGQYVTATGNITIINSNPLTGIPTAGSFVALALGNQTSMTVNVSGTYTGVLSLQASTDGGTTWQTFTNVQTVTSMITGVQAATIASASPGIYKVDVTGLTNVRVSALAAVTGTAVVTLKAVASTSLVMLNGPLPTGTNSIGSVAQATAANLNATVVQGTAANFKATVIDVPNTTGGLLIARLAGGAATTNATSVKASAGQLYAVNVTNTSAAIKYVKFYNKASAPTVGTDTPVLTIAVPVAGRISINLAPLGAAFATGIAYATTALAADTDTTAITAGDIVMEIFYF